MSAELIVASLLNVTGVTALVGTRKALRQLPQNTAMPALVYQVIDSVATPHLNYATERQMARARVQINPLALDVGGVKSIHAAVRAALDFKQQVTAAGKTVISCRLETTGLMDRDNDAGVWTQPADYILMYYE